jgi:hypothetical protein
VNKPQDGAGSNVEIRLINDETIHFPK